jgi:outer membrane immunogenic protein
VLSYFTAGFAYANVKTNASASFGGVTNTFSNERTQGGWVVGSGVEAALGGNWTGKIEYLYLNLGNKSDIAALAAATPINTELRENIFRVGLNYRIGGRAYAPVVAANWAGFLSRRQFRFRHRTGPQHVESAGGRDFPDVQPGARRHQWRRPGGLQLAGGNWVFGLEADIQGSTQKDNKTCVLACVPEG